MRIQASLAVLAVGLLISPVQAVPVTWTGDWFIQQRVSQIIGVGGAESAFGASATRDGDIRDLTADLGVAKAAADAHSDIDQDSSASGLVEFIRPFTLPALPRGWSVTLFGTLSGKLTVRTADKDVTAGAFIDAVARLLNNQGDTVFEIGDPDSSWHDALIRAFINQGPPEKSLLEALEETQNLAEGNYFLYGRIEALAGVTKSPPGIADATSQFFNSLVIGITVTPVAEPPTILLVGTLALTLAALRRRRSVRALLERTRAQSNFSRTSADESSRKCRSDPIGVPAFVSIRTGLRRFDCHWIQLLFTQGGRGHACTHRNSIRTLGRRGDRVGPFDQCD